MYLEYIPISAPVIVDIFVMANNMSYWPENKYVATNNAKISRGNIDILILRI